MKQLIQSLITIVLFTCPIALFGQHADLSHVPDPTPAVKLGNEMLFEKNYKYHWHQEPLSAYHQTPAR